MSAIFYAEQLCLGLYDEYSLNRNDAFHLGYGWLDAHRLKECVLIHKLNVLTLRSPGS